MQLLARLALGAALLLVVILVACLMSVGANLIMEIGL